jgi:hypothetical protein
VFCMTCGKELPDSAKFCRYCGTTQQVDEQADSALPTETASFDFEEFKKEVELLIVNDVIHGLENSKETGFTVADNPKVANYILENIDQATTVAGMINIVQHLHDQYPTVFQPSLTKTIQLSQADNSENTPPSTPTLADQMRQFTEVSYARQLFLSAADKHEKEGGNPFELIDLQSNLSKLGFLKNATEAQIKQLLLANNFSEEEKSLLENDVTIYITYLDMFRMFADVIDSPKLLQASFETKTLIYYNSQLKGLADEKKWRDYDALTSQYLEEARETKVAFFLIRPLVKAAHAKIMLNDRRTCREYLDEFKVIVDTALRERPEYTSLSNEDIRQWVQVHQNEAAQITQTYETQSRSVSTNVSHLARVQTQDKSEKSGIRCFTSECSNPVIGQCSGYNGSCGRFYCREHSRGILCANCAAREEREQVIADYFQTAERIKSPGCGAIFTIVTSGALAALAFVTGETASWVTFAIIFGLSLFLAIRKRQKEWETVAQLDQTKLGFAEFYGLYKNDKNAERVGAAFGLAGSMVAGAASGAVSAGKQIVADEKAAMDRAAYGTNRDVADAVRDLNKTIKK